VGDGQSAESGDRDANRACRLNDGDETLDQELDEVPGVQQHRLEARLGDVVLPGFVGLPLASSGRRP
jgi:hypothetical protein